MDEAVFPRSFLRAYPQAVRAEGCFVYTAEGRRCLDASGGAAVVTIGHGVEEVARAMAEQAAQLAYVHSSQFHTAVAKKSCTSEFSRWHGGNQEGRPRLFYFWRVGGHGNCTETGAAILDRARAKKEGSA